MAKKLRKMRCGEIEWVYVPDVKMVRSGGGDWDDLAPHVEKAGIQAYAKGLYDLRVIDWDNDTNHVVIQRYCKRD